jgi:hypothetical protein
MLKKTKMNFPFTQSLVLNYLFFNTWLIQNPDLVISDYKNWIFTMTPIWLLMLFFNAFALLLLFFKKLQFNQSPIFYVFAFIIFQFTNIYSIDPNYFWTAVPDSTTYAQLGETLLSCGKLAINCTSESLLQWPIGQPIISGLLSLIFYEYAKYVYLILFSVSFYFILFITKSIFGKSYHFGAVYFLLIPTNYELSSLIISEIPYLFFTSLFLYSLFTNKTNASFTFSIISFLVRPIGIINIFIFFINLIYQNRDYLKKYISYLSLVLVTLMTYNYIFNDLFTISTTLSTNIAGDGFVKNYNPVQYIGLLVTSNNFEFIMQNFERLYGEGSRDCFFKNCFLYNPLFMKDGTVPTLLSANTIFGQLVNPIVSSLFKLTSPLGIWLYLPILFLFSITTKLRFINYIFLIFLLNIIFSILTSEYGSRWWLLPDLLTINLLSSLFYKIGVR